ncbi:hypothetical protein DT019_03055 [Streptomyces sp. SDr-06]|uniref:hypothetical protein n=1 Tax=Streptomyces sp. SDr-06 TaxID=2267702 RepID=UPI000DEB3201|nr:hypothetical protein [Streptomyces sp. SDr-06]RCH70482.1 hypothetical protein DT019_03055 [Streptomyces sp. SDr-06]
MNRPARQPATRRTSSVVDLLTFITACTTGYLAGHGAAHLGANGLLAVAAAISAFVITRTVLTRSNARHTARRHTHH